MKKFVTLICLLTISAGIANAHPYTVQGHHKPLPTPQKIVHPPKPMPMANQYPAPIYNSYGYNNPSVTFSVGNIDLTVGL